MLTSVNGEFFKMTSKLDKILVGLYYRNNLLHSNNLLPHLLTYVKLTYFNNLLHCNNLLIPHLLDYCTYIVITLSLLTSYTYIVLTSYCTYIVLTSYCTYIVLTSYCTYIVITYLLDYYTYYRTYIVITYLLYGLLLITYYRKKRLKKA